MKTRSKAIKEINTENGRNVTYSACDETWWGMKIQGRMQMERYNMKHSPTRNYNSFVEYLFVATGDITDNMKATE
jgi:hypothetical protein